MTYEQFESKMNEDYKGKMQELSQFAMENSALYEMFRERYQRQQDEQTRIRNVKLGASTHENKPYSMK